MVEPESAGTGRIPVNRDIVEILTHLNRRTAASRAALARDPVTIAYLEAGCRLLARQFVQPTSDGDQINRPFLAWISRDVLFEEMRSFPAGPLPRQPSPGTFRDRWQSKSDFVGDLVSYAVWSRSGLTGSESQPAGGLSVPASTATAIDVLARQEMGLRLHPLGIDALRVRIHLQPTADLDTSLGEIVADAYRRMAHSWVVTFRAIITAQGRALRDGISVGDLAVILTGTAEGLALRSLVEDPAGRPDVRERGRLLAVAATGLLAGCTVSRFG